MEYIIQIVIIIFIFLALIKRIKEIAEKGGEIKAPPVSPPVSQPEMTEELNRRFVETEEEAVKPEDKPVLSVEDIFEKFAREYVEPETSHEPEITPESEIIPEAEITPEVEKPVPEVVMSLLQARAAPLKAAPTGVKLNFGGSGLVTGILMSEILGPPVALRKEHLQR